MKIKMMLIAAVLFSMLLVGITSSAPYDPWCDLDDDGDIDIFDIVKIAGAYGTTGTPINKTELLLDLQSRVASLEELTALLANGTCVVDGGKFDGDVQADMVETVPGGVAVIGYTTPFTTIEKPAMLVMVVMKGDSASSGLVEGAAVKAVEDVKGSAGNWTGFDITVTKHSGGSLIDGTDVFVTWIAIGTGSSVFGQGDLTIGPTEFTPEVPRLQAFWKTRYAVGGSGSCFACVQLPEGAVITNVTARLEDFYDDAQVAVGLYRVNTTGPSETSDSLASIYSGTAAQPGDVTLYDDTIDYAQIDNEHFYYMVELYLNYEASDLNLHWVQLTYEY